MATWVKPENMKNNQIIVKVTKKQKEIIQQNAEKAKMPISEYIRQLVFGEPE